ncbi:glutathione S-transferase family protein [Kordiimonas sp.]|uniref:glutathione S-transferase family protein n=1 Tax=Kordiimonas sp. TaxID=1970157 RepID=UPI003A8ECC28
MKDEITIIGTPISPYVRKVLAILDIKGVPFRCIPLVPFRAEEDFSEISPLRRIPVMKVGDFTIPDSTVIAQYLEDRFPEKRVYPEGLEARARSRWFEEYADDHFGRNIIFNLFFQKRVKPAILKQEPDQALIDSALNDHLPKALNYLEREVPDDGFLCGDVSVADLMLGAMVRNAVWADWALDETAWPRFAAYLKRVNAVPSLAKMNALADEMLLAHPKQHEEIMAKHLQAA